MGESVIVFLTVSGVGGEEGAPALARPTATMMGTMHTKSFISECAMELPLSLLFYRRASSGYRMEVMD